MNLVLGELLIIYDLITMFGALVTSHMLASY